MAQITITDTGKYYIGASIQSGEQIAVGDAGVTGDPLTLKNTNLALGQSVFTSDPKQSFKYGDNVQTNAYDFGEVESTGIDQPKWTLACYFQPNSEEDMKMFGRLIFMCRTKGYKTLSSSTGDGFYDLIAYSKYGERESDGESIKTIDSINVRIKSISVNQTADKKGFRATLNLVETN